MNRIRLFIEGEELELKEDIQVAITKQFEELDNPTVICNDYSKTVNIPMTARNNQIFGHIYDPDRITADSEGVISYVGIYFDPMKKVDFRLLWNNDTLMEGYMKMLSATRQNGTGYYEITLNGTLGKIFQELKKLTFDSAITAETEDAQYYINTTEMLSTSITRDFIISKDLVYSGWTTSQHTASIDSPDCKITDIIGFAPCNAFDEDFEYDTFQYGETSSKTFEEVLGTAFTQDTGVEPKTVIPDGMTPRGIGEYRSYLQQPYIYFNKLFQIFRKKAEDITGYKFELDADWFNTNNPFWYRLVFMLKKLDTTSDPPSEFISSTSMTEYELVEPFTDWFYTPKNTEKFPFDFKLNVSNEIYDADTGYFQLPEGEDWFFEGKAKTIWYINTRNGQLIPNQENLYATIRNDAMLVQEFKFYDQNDNLIATQKFGACSTGTTMNLSGYTKVTKIEKIYPSEVDTLPVYTSIKSIIPYTQIGTDPFRIEVSSYVEYGTTSQYNGMNTPFNYNVYDNAETDGTLETRGYSQTDTFILSAIRARQTRSYSRFTINKLWNNEYNLFEQILNYCKMYRIFILADEKQKKLKFIQSHKYFENYRIKDWTDKVCMDMDYVVKPITWEYKYVLFNYEDSETALGEHYREQYGYDWGEKRLITEYNFNTETNELFNGVRPSLVNTNNILSWVTLYENHQIIYMFPAETSICMRDDDGKYVDQFGGWYIERAIAQFDTTSDMRSVSISDDTDFQVETNTFFYSQQQDGIQVDTYPRLDVITTDKRMCLFGVPTENYTYMTTGYTNATAIYDNVWKKYVNERYNKHNKMVTCYIYMTPSDFIDFKFSDFIRIENQLYIVNKIYDFNAVSNQKVKVDLITVQDITGYTTR